MAYILVLLGLASCVALAHGQQVTVNTKKGQVIGATFTTTATKVTYDGFLGIPYAQQPNRFQPAVPPAAWSTPLTVTKDGAICPQPNVAAFSENCLFINVFTPQGAAAASATTKYPVMAFIHGSGYTISSSDSTIYGPDFFVNANVVLVTFNYRLGANGFLTLGSKVAPGNLGLTDTLLALQWIHDEIAAFGGDPAQVTLFGESAGGAVVTFHYLSPQSTGLFTKAIAQSGTALADWAVVPLDEGVRRSKVLAQAVGCDTNQNDTLLLTCLQKANISDIVNKQNINLDFQDEVSGTIGIRFVPVWDTISTADLPFFNDTLSNLMQAALARGKPLMNGFNTNDGSIKVTFPGIGDSWKQAQSNLGSFVPRPRRSVIADSTKNQLGQDIGARYFTNTFDENKILDILNLYTDTMFAYPSAKVSKYFANLTYAYVFNYYGTWDFLLEFPYPMKVVQHGDELPYMFYASAFSKPADSADSCSLNTANLRISTTLVNLWTSFAKTGAPSDTTWKKVSDNIYYVIDTTPSTMNSTVFEDKYYNFWANVEKSGAVSLGAGLLSLLCLLLAIPTIALN